MCRSFQPGEGTIRGLLWDCKTLRNLWQPSFSSSNEGPRDWRDDSPRRHRRGRDGQLQRVGHHDDLHLGCGRGVEKCSTFLHSLIAVSFCSIELFSQKGFQSLMKFRWINLFVECSKMFSWSYGIHFSWNGSKLVYPKIYNELYSQEQHPWKEYLYRIVAKVTHRRFYLFFYLFFSIYLQGNTDPYLF